MKSVFRSVMRRASDRYAAGDSLGDAISVAKQADSLGYNSTVCYWHVSLEDPEKVCQHYLTTLDRIAAERLDCNMALKVPGLWERQDLIEAVVQKARALDIGIEIDSHEPEKADDVIRSVSALDPEKITVAIPGRWTRSLEMAEWAIEQGLAVRVVKGGWVDPAQPRLDPHKGYRDVVARLAGRCREVAVATHHPELAEHCFEVLSSAGTPMFQQLVYGLPMKAVSEVASKRDIPTRVYIPYGHAWVPYAIGRALREPKIFYWLARDLVTGDREPLPPKREMSPKSAADTRSASPS